MSPLKFREELTVQNTVVNIRPIDVRTLHAEQWDSNLPHIERIIHWKTFHCEEKRSGIWLWYYMRLAWCILKQGYITSDFYGSNQACITFPRFFIKFEVNVRIKQLQWNVKCARHRMPMLLLHDLCTNLLYNILTILSWRITLWKFAEFWFTFSLSI